MVSPAPARIRTTRHSSPGPASLTRPGAAPQHHPPAGDPGVTGRYRLDPRTTSWWWSPEMYALLGVSPDGAQPCTEVFLQCQHREDRARTLAAIERAVATGSPFAVETRVLRRDGALRVLVLMGQPQPGDDGAVAAVEGLCVDITSGRLAHDEDVVTALQAEVTQLRTAMASRATIEQAKGILMLLTSCSEQVAFELLAHMSSHTHRKVREVAQSIADSASGHAPLPADLRAILRDACPPAPRLT
jgi:PAS domain-containing protein